MLSGYELKFKKYIDDVKSTCHYLINKKTGMRVLFLENDDENKVFSIGFKTKVHNNTGVAHILEHSVLCGSEKYPIKDPFIELAKGSLNTFLNAMTYPDKTLYPVASTNDKDFKNLMSVYLDAVFKPNIYKHKEIFMQEGWHHVLNNKEDNITYSGVVYNEMKGAYSSASDLLSREVEKSIFNNHSYGYDSGGDPAHIIDLTYEDFLEFHKKNYNPSNAYLYFYGKLDIKEHLKFIDENYINAYDRVENLETIEMPSPKDIIKEVKAPYPVADDNKIETLSQFSYNVAVDIREDTNLYQALDILCYVLVNAPGAPVSKALYDAKIAEDVSASFDTPYIKPLIKITAANADIKRFDEFKSIIDDVLNRVVREGIDKTALLGAINTSEFSFRESDFGTYPKGLLYYLTLLDSWIYDDDKPTVYLEQFKMFDFLKKNIDTGYFENTVKKYILENEHKTFVAIYPKLNLQEKIDEALNKRACEYKKSLSGDEITALIDENIGLGQYQSAPDRKEDTDKIPILNLSDIKKESAVYELDKAKIGDNLYLSHICESNGIFYSRFMFDADINMAYLPYLSILSNVLGMVDTENYSYNELRNQINVNLGGLRIDTMNYSSSKDKDKYKVFLSLNMKGLFSNIEKGLLLAKEVLLKSKLDDKGRIREILQETKIELEESIIRYGNNYASSVAGSIVSEALRASDLLKGLAFYDKLNQILNDYENEFYPLIKKLENLMNYLICKERLVINYTGSLKGSKIFEEKAGDFIKDLPKSEPLKDIDEKLSVYKNTGIIAQSLTVQFVARAGLSDIKKYPYSGIMSVLKVLLGYDYLWNEVRVKGGAYGCGATMFRNGVLYLNSYRDPNLKSTEEIFENTANYLRNLTLSEREIRQYIIGAISNFDVPLGAYLRGLKALTMYYSDISDSEMQKERDEVLSTRLSDIQKIADIIDNAIKNRYACTIGSKDMIGKHSDMFDNVRNLNL